jgi:hypothetical protein
MVLVFGRISPFCRTVGKPFTGCQHNIGQRSFRRSTRTIAARKVRNPDAVGLTATVENADMMGHRIHPASFATSRATQGYGSSAFNC